MRSWWVAIMVIAVGACGAAAEPTAAPLSIATEPTNEVTVAASSTSPVVVAPSPLSVATTENLQQPQTTTTAPFVTVPVPTSRSTEPSITTRSVIDAAVIVHDIDAGVVGDLAADLGASILVVADDDGWITHSTERTVSVQPPVAGWRRWGGEVMLWSRFSSGKRRTVAVNSAGDVVCDLPHDIASVTSEGNQWTAFVELTDDIQFQDAMEVPIPATLISCSSQRAVEVPPRSFVGDQPILRRFVSVGSRTFEEVYDQEGNADVFNEAGAPITGDDYAGRHAFNSDGSVIAYGDLGFARHPHATNLVKARDTTTGELLWSMELDGAFDYLQHVGNSVIVGVPDRAGVGNEALPEYLVVIDTASGAGLRRVDSQIRVIHAE